MPTEIERKFLVVGNQWRDMAIKEEFIRQGYLCSGSNATVRVRTKGNRATFTVKGRGCLAGNALHRPEFEYCIANRAEAHAMLDELCSGFVVKRRSDVQIGSLTWEIDVFIVPALKYPIAEIELDHPGQEFERPVWLGEEVTHDPFYSNSNLAAQGSWSTVRDLVPKTILRLMDDERLKHAE